MWGSLGEGWNEDEHSPPCPQGWLVDLGARCSDCLLIAHWAEGYLKFDRMEGTWEERLSRRLMGLMMLRKGVEMGSTQESGWIAG